MRLRSRCKWTNVYIRAWLFLNVCSRAPVKTLFFRRFELVIQVGIVIKYGHNLAQCVNILHGRIFDKSDRLHLIPHRLFRREKISVRGKNTVSVIFIARQVYICGKSPHVSNKADFSRHPCSISRPRRAERRPHVGVFIIAHRPALNKRFYDKEWGGVLRRCPVYLYVVCQNGKERG